jgi:hypothetical protein
MYEGADHQLTEYRKEYLNNTLQWFDRFVKNNETLPDMKLHGR